MIKPILVVAAVLLAACSEKPQDLARGKKPDTPSWQDPPKAYADPDWKSGDRKTWEEHLRVRAQKGQNEYTRGSGKS